MKPTPSAILDRRPAAHAVPAAARPMSRLTAALGPRMQAAAPSPSHAARGRFTVQRVVGSFVPKLTRKAFEKYGFSTASLFTDWEAVVGRDMALICVPERLKWPRQTEIYGDVDPGAEGRPGATLILKVDAARALDIQYRRAEIADRINAYFGYRAIAEVKISQAPAGSLMRAAPSTAVETSYRSPTAPPSASAPIATDLSAIDDEGLRAALAKLEAAVTSARAR